MAKGIRALLDTVMQALPQVGNLGLLFFLLFFIFAALGVELFGRLECTELFPCQGLGEHAHFRNFGMAFLTLFRVATGDNWNGIMKDTLRDNCDSSSDCIRNCCVSPIIAPLYFVIFVLMAQFVLVNVVVAVLMKHLEESHQHMDDDLEMDVEIERELAAEREVKRRKAARGRQKQKAIAHRNLFKMYSLPANFTFTFQGDDKNGRSPPENGSSTVAAVTIEISAPGCFEEPKREAGTPCTFFVPTGNINLKQVSPDDQPDKVSVADLSQISINFEEELPVEIETRPAKRPQDIPQLLVSDNITPDATLTSVSTGTPTPLVGAINGDETDSGTSTQCLLQTYPELGDGQSPDSGSWNASSHSEMASESWPRTTDTETYGEAEDVEDAFLNVQFPLDETGQPTEEVELSEHSPGLNSPGETPLQDNQTIWATSETDTSPDC